MATVTDAQGDAVSRERQLEVLVALGFSEATARFIVAVEMQEIAGDLVRVDDQDHEIQGGQENADA